MSYVSEKLRRQVKARSKLLCEYCGIHQDDSLYTHEVDHIIPVKHRGETTLENLCVACFACNRYKGSDFASFDPDTGDIIPLYNPRKDQWDVHFRLDGVQIMPLTSIGRVTVFVLRFNDDDRLREREALASVGRYPLD